MKEEGENLKKILESEKGITKQNVSPDISPLHSQIQENSSVWQSLLSFVLDTNSVKRYYYIR